MHEDTELAKKVQELAGQPLYKIPITGIDFLIAVAFYDKLLQIESKLTMLPAATAAKVGKHK